jgi:hypothetical protein
MWPRLDFKAKPRPLVLSCSIRVRRTQIAYLPHDVAVLPAAWDSSFMPVTCMNATYRKCKLFLMASESELSSRAVSRRIFSPTLYRCRGMTMIPLCSSPRVKNS